LAFYFGEKGGGVVEAKQQPLLDSIIALCFISVLWFVVLSNWAKKEHLISNGKKARL
jgi:competence protein ComGC